LPLRLYVGAIHMAKKKKKLSIKKAIRRPGALTRASKAAHMSVAAYAQKHRHDKGLRGKQARFYFTLQKMRKKK